jgi:hypothetical protein
MDPTNNNFLLRLGLHQVSNPPARIAPPIVDPSLAFRAAMQGGGDEEEQGGKQQQQQQQEAATMEIGWPTDVRHVAHVTFDRFHGFRGVPEELRREVEGRPPSASATVFGVSTESMQCSYDGRGNSVPTILLHLQRRLYDQGGLAAEGVFRIAADGAQEQRARDQLNSSGVVPDGVDVHCLAGLIKVRFALLAIICKS